MGVEMMSLPEDEVHTYSKGDLQLDAIDVWIMAGQSNMVGENMESGNNPKCCGPIPDRLLAFNVESNPNDTWVDAQSCVGCRSRSAAGFWNSCGPDLAFGRVLLQLGVSRRVGFVPTALGSTTIMSHWCAGCPLAAQMVEAAKRAMATAGPNARLRGMLWVQGETDASDPYTPLDYNREFDKFLVWTRDLLRPYHPNLPVVMAVMSTTNRVLAFPGIEELRRQQASYNTTNLLKVDMQDYEFYSQWVPNFSDPTKSIRGQDVHLTKNGSCHMGGDMAYVYAQSGMQQGW